MEKLGDYQVSTCTYTGKPVKVVQETWSGYVLVKFAIASTAVLHGVMSFCFFHTSHKTEKDEIFIFTGSSSL